MTDTIYPVDTRNSTKGKTEVKVWNLIPSDRRDTTNNTLIQRQHMEWGYVSENKKAREEQNNVEGRTLSIKTQLP